MVGDGRKINWEGGGGGDPLWFTSKPSPNRVSSKTLIISQALLAPPAPVMPASGTLLPELAGAPSSQAKRE